MKIKNIKHRRSGILFGNINVVNMYYTYKSIHSFHTEYVLFQIQIWAFRIVLVMVCYTFYVFYLISVNVLVLICLLCVISYELGFLALAIVSAASVCIPFSCIQHRHCISTEVCDQLVLF